MRRWIGHSEKVAENHYIQELPDDFLAAYNAEKKGARAGYRMDYNELEYRNRHILVEWRDEWDITNCINDHCTFRILPQVNTPGTILSNGLTAFQYRLPSWKPDIDFDNAPVMAESKDRFFDKYAKQRKNESNTDFEFRIVYYFRELFAAVKRHIEAKQQRKGVR